MPGIRVQLSYTNLGVSSQASGWAPVTFVGKLGGRKTNPGPQRGHEQWTILKMWVSTQK